MSSITSSVPGAPDYVEGVLSSGESDEDGLPTEGGGNGESDPLYDQAVEVVLKSKRASISLVRRHCASVTTARRG